MTKSTDNLEQQKTMDIIYQEYIEVKDKATENYKKRKITLQQRANELTKANVNYRINQETIGFRYYFVDKYPEIFNLDEVYEKKMQEYLNMDLTIIVNNNNQPAIDLVIKNNSITQYKLFNIDDLLFYVFSFSFENKFIMEKLRENENNGVEREKYYLDFLNPESSYYNSLNTPRFKFLIGLTPLKNIFSNINYLLIEPFNKIYHAMYLSINNGCEIYCLSNRFEEKGKSPRFYNDLGNVFRSSWEADIARILNYREVKWDFEKEGFLLDIDKESNKKLSYIPDFFLSNNLILEIKGFWNYESVNKVYMFKNQIKNYDLKIIDTDMFYSLYKKYQHIISNLESVNIRPSKEQIPVVGIQFKERKPFVNALIEGEKVFLHRDINNEYDKNAIKVLNLQDNFLGYMAKEWASIFAEKMDLGMKYEAVVKSKEPKVLYLNVKRINIDEEIIYDFFE
jgi:hypothetical protein